METPPPGPFPGGSLKPPVAGWKEALEMAKDPVCGMAVDNQSSYRSTHAGQTFAFCGPACKTRFDKEPGRYAAPGGGEVQRGNRL